MKRYKGQNLKTKNQEQGITLVALVITIIIIIILATITIGGVFGGNGLINNTKYTAFSVDVRAYEEAANRYVVMQQLEHGADTNINIMDKEQIKEAIPGITDEDAEKYVIQDNEFKYNPDYVTEQEEKWLIQLGIAAMTLVTLFTITFMVNGSEFQTIQSDVMTFPEVDPTNGNANFAGWFYDADYTREAHEGELLSGDITLYAKWTGTVTFMSNGSVYHTINTDTLTFPETDPTSNNGSTFGGWFYDESYSNQANEGDKITENVTIYAKWIHHITNKLNNASVNMFSHSAENQTGSWYYVETEEDLVNAPNYDSSGGSNTPYVYPAWVKYGNYSATEKIYSYEGSANIVSARIISWTMSDRETPFTAFNLSINSNGEVYVTGSENNYIGSIYAGYAKIEVTFEDGSTDTDEFSVRVHWACFIEGTLITLADRSQKKIEDITYDDKLLVWDFDNGCFAEAKPLWIKKRQAVTEYNLIKFDNGTELKTVIDHRIFNMEAQKFTYTMNEEDTPIGTTTFLADGTTAKLIERKVVKETVNYYNIITDYHMNLFAEGILTSLRLNNLYKIENMKFVKDDRKLAPREEYANVPDKYFYGLRLAEQPKEVNRGNDAKHTKTLTEYVDRLIELEK